MTGSTPPPADDLRDRLSNHLERTMPKSASGYETYLQDELYFGLAGFIEAEVDARVEPVLAQHRDTEAKIRQALQTPETGWLIQLHALAVRQERDRLRADQRIRHNALLDAVGLTSTEGVNEPTRYYAAIEAAHQQRRELADLRAGMVAVAAQRDDAETERTSMVRDLHAAQFDGSTLLPDRPLDTTWNWLLDLVRKDRARLSAGSPTIPDDARTQLRDYLTGWLPARLSVPYDDTVEEIAMALAVSLVDDVLSEWRDDSSIRQPAIPDETWRSNLAKPDGDLYAKLRHYFDEPLNRVDSQSAADTAAGAVFWFLRYRGDKTPAPAKPPCSTIPQGMECPGRPTVECAGCTSPAPSAATPKADGEGDLRGTLTALAADFRSRAEQTSLAYDEGEAPEDDCDSPAECHASARYLTWKLAARALEKALPVPPSGATDPATATPTEDGTK